MVRSFRSDPVSTDVIFRCVELASRAPSAGKTQGWHLLVLQGADTAQYWNIAFPEDRRGDFSFPQLFDAPVIALVCTDTRAYTDRYSEADKSHTGLGNSLDAWVAPYWTIDASFATMTLLLALEDEGLGALFFAHSNEQLLRNHFGIPEHVQILGTIAFGYESDASVREGRSASRPRHTPDQIIHFTKWSS